MVEEKRTDEGLPTRHAAAPEDVEPRRPRRRRGTGLVWMVLALLAIIAIGWLVWAFTTG